MADIFICKHLLYTFFLWISLTITLTGQATVIKLDSTSIQNVLTQSERLARYGYRDSSNILIQQLLQKTTSASKKIRAKTLLSMAKHHLLFMEYDSALLYTSQALSITNHKELRTKKIEALWLYGFLHFKKLDLASSLQYCEEGLSAATELGDKWLEAQCLSCIAYALRTYHNTPKFEKATAYFEQALTIFEVEKDTAALVRTLIVLTDIYRSNNQQIDRADTYHKYAKTLLNQYRHDILNINHLAVGGTLSEQKGLYKNAISNLEQAITLSNSLKLGYLSQHINLHLASLYEIQERYVDALQALDKAIAAYPGYLHDNGSTYYASVYKKMGNYKKALEHLEQALEVNDLELVTKQSEMIAEWEARFQLQEQENKLQQQTQKIQSQKQRTLLLSTSTILFLLLAGFLTYSIYLQKKASKQLSHQHTIIEQQAKELRKLDRVKSRFFANVSHELRTPLTLIRGPLSSALKSQTLSKVNFSYLQIAQQSTDDLLNRINEILDLSKMESGKLELHEQTVALLPFLSRLISQFESHAQYHNIELAFNCQPGLSLQLKLDLHKFETIVNNLLSNAFKYTQSGGRVDVCLKDTGNMITLNVSDTGIGISPDDLPYIYDRFYQSNRADAPAQGGVGIGLALSKELALLMEGNIMVQSKPGVGSSFTLKLPKREVLGAMENLQSENKKEESLGILTALENTKNRIEPSVNLPLKQASILLVEDNYFLREYLQSIFSPQYNVVIAENGQMALDYLLEMDHCQLIISDIMMPVMDGFQLLEKLKNDDRWRPIPVIMLTARADIQDKLKALRIGVDDYILKPFEEDELMIRVENLLNNYRERREALESDGIIAPPKADFSLEDKQWLENIEQLIHQQIDNNQYTITQLAHEIAISERQLRRRLKQLTGLSPSQYLKETRLQYGRRLLEQYRYKTVAQTAAAVGFSDTRAFSRNFLQRFGKKPSNYLNN